MAISTVQQGLITEAEFVKIVILGTNGELVPERPLADDERRDFDIRMRRHFREYLGLQLKSSRTLRRHGRAWMLQINFRRKPPMDSNPDYWYFLAHFDVEAMAFSDPVFLVPSAYLHRYARHGTRGGAMLFQFKASMEPESGDRWARFRLSRDQLGPRIVEMLEDRAAKRRSNRLPALPEAPGTLWLMTRVTAARFPMRSAA